MGAVMSRERRSEYTAAGAVGLALDAANATAEPEMRVLLGQDAGLYSARMPDYDGTAVSIELQLDGIDVALAQLGVLPIDIAAVAATGVAYAAGETRWAQLLRSLEGYRGFAAISAAEAVAHALEMLHARRIALVVDARTESGADATRFLEQRGFTVADITRAQCDADYGHHAPSTTTVLAAARSIDTQHVDAILLADTEMPTLGALDALLGAGQIPVLSANFCLGWGCAQQLAGLPADARSLGRWLADDAQWRMRLGYAFPSAVAPRPSIF
jgi:maleate isomerase